MSLNLKFKVVLAGDGGVGKSTILYHFLEKKELTTMTKGLAIEKLTIPLNEGKRLNAFVGILGDNLTLDSFLRIS